MILCSAKRISFLCLLLGQLCVQDISSILTVFLNGMNWFIISWSLCLKRSQSGSGESMSGAWF